MKLILIAFVASQIAQISKVLFYYLKHRKWEWYRMFHASGMPSAHSAAVISVATFIGLTRGVNDFIFGLSIVLAAIVVYDATNVRYQAGLHAQILNDIVENDKMRVYQKNAGVKNPKGELKELIGHTIMEAIGGIILGILTGYFFFQFYGV